MHKAFHFIAFLALLTIGPAAFAQDTYPIVDPNATSKQISELLTSAKPEEAAAVVEKSLPPIPSMQFNLEQIKSAFKLLTNNGAADFKDEMSSKQYGQSVLVIMHYVHFPRQEVPANQFVFLRYTFMKGGKGWMMTAFDFKTSGLFPPPGWGN